MRQERESFYVDYSNEASVPSTKEQMWNRGTIKWFDPTRRYGWIIPEEASDDVFLPWTTLRRCNIKETEAQEGARVVFRSVPPKKSGEKRTAAHVRMVIRR